VKEFTSYCGGLPEPSIANNPLGFKFSWSPRGALMSQDNAATFLSGGKQVDIPAEELMKTAKPYYVMDGYSFVAYPNRNSVPFKEFYNIPEAETVIRGSLRYAGNPTFVQALKDLGFLDQGEKGWLKEGITWKDVLIKMTGSTADELVPAIEKLCSFPTTAEAKRVLDGLEWIDLFSTNPAPVRDNLLDTLCAQLETLMSYQPGERDLVMLQHKFLVEWKDGKTDTITSTLELLGDPNGFSAMAKSVGVTCGIASQLVLEKRAAFARPGIWAPYSKEICEPIRALLECEGIMMVEKVL
jgi:saccharopine dehydrogenase (NADP+, L-glutamate forming)